MEALRLDITVNGRFLTRPSTGVDRVAYELVRALILLKRAGRWSGRLRVPYPAGGTLERPVVARLDRLARGCGGVEIGPRGRLSGLVWEQVELPLLARRGQLLSPCNIGPLASRRQLVILHDAQIHAFPEPYTRAFRLLYGVAQPRLARHAERVTTISQHAREALERHGVVPKGKARVVPNGVDHMRRIATDRGALERHGLAPGGYVLAVGSLAPHKNLAMLAAAARARPPGSPPLVLAGQTGDPRVFAAAGVAEGGGVRRLGRVSDGELKALYRGALALAFPSFAEGFGLPALEAMALGCPVIAASAGALPEVCGDAALYVDPADAPGWTAALQRIATDPVLRRSLSERGRAQARRFRWATAADALLAELAAEPVG